MIGVAYSPRQPPAAYPLMKEAWERRRRRRLALAWTVCSVVAAAVLAISLGPGLPFLGRHTAAYGPVTRAAIVAQADKTVTTFDNDLANGNYAGACKLLAPAVGTAALRADTDAVGIHGTCPQRLAGFAHIVGPQVLSEINPAWEQSLLGNNFQFGRTETGGFDAASVFAVPDPTLYPNLMIQNVGVGRANRDAPVLITSPPLIGSAPWGETFLDVYLRNKRVGMRPPTIPFSPASE